MDSFRIFNQEITSPIIEQLNNLLTDVDFIRICGLCGINEEVESIILYSDKIAIRFIEINCVLIIDESYDILLKWTTTSGGHGILEVEHSFKRKVWDFIATRITLHL